MMLMMPYKFSDIVPSTNCIAHEHNLMFLAWNDTILFYCSMHLAKDVGVSCLVRPPDG